MRTSQSVPGGSITEGMLVEVHGTLNNNTIVANRIEQEDDASNDFDNGDQLSVQGAISEFVDQEHFAVNGVAVDATNAALEPAGLVLADGVIVEVEGTWNGSTLVAKEVEARRGWVELDAKVASVNAPGGTLTLQFVTGTVTIQVDGTTQLDDDTDQVDSLTLGDITSGDFLQVEAIKIGGSLLASRVRRDDEDDNILQAQVDSFNAGVDITLLGVTFSTAGAEFENQNNSALSSEIFFGQLQVGDLVKVKDQGCSGRCCGYRWSSSRRTRSTARSSMTTVTRLSMARMTAVIRTIRLIRLIRTIRTIRLTQMIRLIQMIRMTAAITALTQMVTVLQKLIQQMINPKTRANK